MDKRRAEWLASELQDERETVKQRLRYAVRFHEGVELNDMQHLVANLKSTCSKYRVCEVGAHGSQGARGKQLHFTKCRKKEQVSHMKGKSGGFAWDQT